MANIESIRDFDRYC